MADPKRSHLGTHTASERERERDWKIRLTHSANKSLRSRLSTLHLLDGNQNEHKYVCQVTS